MSRGNMQHERWSEARNTDKNKRYVIASVYVNNLHNVLVPAIVCFCESSNTLLAMCWTPYIHVFCGSSYCLPSLFPIILLAMVSKKLNNCNTCLPIAFNIPRMLSNSWDCARQRDLNQKTIILWNPKRKNARHSAGLVAFLEIDKVLIFQVDGFP